MSTARLKTLVPVTGLPDATHVSIDVFYSKGGMNYTTYKTEPRGYYAAVRPVTVDVRPTGFTSEAFMMFDDRAFKVFLKPATRLNAKVLASLAEATAPHADTLAALVVAGSKTAAVDLLVRLAA